jgi:hypothetical protein
MAASTLASIAASSATPPSTSVVPAGKQHVDCGEWPPIAALHATTVDPGSRWHGLPHPLGSDSVKQTGVLVG